MDGMQTKERFWMVLGAGRPTVKHSSFEAAYSEAKRLARAHMEETFVVLEAVTAVRKSEFTTVTYRAPSSAAAPAVDDKDIPF
jgi:hypothetical protein